MQKNIEKGVLPMNLLISVLEDCFVYANFWVALTFILQNLQAGKPMG